MINIVVKVSERSPNFMNTQMKEQQSIWESLPTFLSLSSCIFCCSNAASVFWLAAMTRSCLSLWKSCSVLIRISFAFSFASCRMNLHICLICRSEDVIVIDEQRWEKCYFPPTYTSTFLCSDYYFYTEIN